MTGCWVRWKKGGTLVQVEKGRNPGLQTKERVKMGYELPELDKLRQSISDAAHFRVQLSFCPCKCPGRKEAEFVFNSKDFTLELGYLRNWDRIF